MAIVEFTLGRGNAFMEYIPQELLKDEESSAGSLAFGLKFRSEEAGVCLLTVFGRTAKLRYIRIRDDLWDMGIGTDFLLDVLLELRVRGYARFSLAVLPSDGPLLIHMAKRFSMERRETGKAFFTFKLSDAVKLASRHGDRKGIRAVSQLTQREKEALWKRLESEFGGGENPMTSLDRDADLCLCKFDNEDNMAGLFVDAVDQKLYLSWVFNDTGGLTTTEGLFSEAFDRALEKYPLQTTVSVVSLNEQAATLLSKINAVQKEELEEYSMDLTLFDTVLEGEDE